MKYNIKFSKNYTILLEVENVTSHVVGKKDAQRNFSFHVCIPHKPKTGNNN